MTTPTDTEVGIGTPSTARSGLHDALPDLLRQHPAAGRIRLGEQHDELVAAEPGARVDLADARPHDVADELQRAVAVEVPEAVVDRFEVVEVDHQQAEAAARALAAVDLAIERGEQVGAGPEAREQVLGRLAVGVLACAALLPSDRHADVGDQAQGGQVDARGRDDDLAGRTRAGLRVEGHGREVGRAGAGGQQERRLRRHDDRRADDDERAA